MFDKFRRLLFFCKRRIHLLLLAASAVLGLRSGIHLAAKSALLVSMMRIAAQCNVSIVGLMFVAYVPFLCCLCAISASQPWSIYPICFCRLLLHGSCAAGIASAFGSAGWLMRCLLSFTDRMTLPLFLWFSFRSLDHPYLSKRECLVYVIIAGVIVFADFCLVSPFLANLIKTYETTGRYAVSCWI